ncbi:MAG: hypothetical protein E7265_04455 [Lachnospiraceae bacterium]|nr:hypothetical protein [Lachnospiraceae bacterium]
MKIKLIQITMSIVLLTLLTGCSNNSNSSNVEQTACGVENCNNLVVKNDYGYGIYSYGKYCEEHTCKEDSCGGMIQYRCNVVREDNDTNLATMYIWLSDDGTFTVKELEYDE